MPVPALSLPALLRRELPNWAKVLVLLLFSWVVTDRSGFHPDIPGRILGTVALLLLLLLVGSMGRRIWSVVLFLLVLLLAAFFLTLYLYGPLSYDLALALRYTSVDESMGYVLDLFKPGMVLLWLCCAIACYVVLLRSRIAIANRWAMGGVALALIALPAVRAWRADVNWSNWYKDKSFIFSSVPGKIAATLLHQFSVVNELADHSERYRSGHDWSAFEDMGPARLNVIVIGESGRADFYDPNGFGLFPLTPNIDSTYSFNFTDCLAPASTTISSLMRVLFLTDEAGNGIPEANLISLFKARGARTFWISNQGKLGLNDSPIASLALTCDSVLFLNKHTYHSAHAGDQAMLPWIKGVIGLAKDDPRPTVIFIHMLGQHPPLDRTYGDWDPPVKAEGMVGQFMRSTRDTDLFLGALYTMVRRCPDHRMFYFSDHGLAYDHKGDHFIHSDRYRANFHVPFMIWSDARPRGRAITRPLSLMDLPRIVHALNVPDTSAFTPLLRKLVPPTTVFDSNNGRRALEKLGTDRINLANED
ncbi:MAG: sulfatase-like hydrolase/transferase [Flavobacteriales bacterium]|nr:sulfatase-like hydrolase/transferase [Flavobacteriales bacterium]